MALITDVAPPAPTTTPPQRRFHPRWLVVAAAVLLCAGLMYFLWHRAAVKSPVPENVRAAVDFPIYYPQQSALPKGYDLDTSSFRLAQPGVVIYSVKHGDTQLIFSEEKQPEQATIDKFTKTYLPLKTALKTDMGQAQIGAFGSGKNLRTVVSLPIKGGPWLILTAPASSSHTDIVRIVQALRK